MRLRQQSTNVAFTIFALEFDGGDCPAIDYLRALKLHDGESHAGMHALLSLHALQGPIKNKTKCRQVEGKKNKGLWEFKTGQGGRLVFFYQPGKRTILTNGFNKGDSATIAYEIARKYKTEWEAK